MFVYIYIDICLYIYIWTRNLHVHGRRVGERVSTLYLACLCASLHARIPRCSVCVVRESVCEHFARAEREREREKEMTRGKPQFVGAA